MATDSRPARIVVAGLINLETTLRVDGFPIHYHPVRYPFFGVGSMVSGVGYNVARALATLGNEVRLLSLAGSDPISLLVRQALQVDGLITEGVRFDLAHTPQSVVLFDGDGRRQINVDLKDVQEQPYPAEAAAQALETCAAAVLCNVNFARPMLAQARQQGRLIATDVHAIADLDDDYNQDFMRAADLLFMSHERLPLPPEDWARRVMDRYGNELVVVGLGADGAVLAVKRDGFVGRFPAARVRPVVNSVGAGDALLASFLHSYLLTRDPYASLRRAQVFAAYKIGARGAAEGFLTGAELEQLLTQV